MSAGDPVARLVIGGSYRTTEALNRVGDLVEGAGDAIAHVGHEIRYVGYMRRCRALTWAERRAGDVPSA